MEIIDINLRLLETAMEKGWTLNPNKRKLVPIMKSMAKKAHGELILCPCKVYVEGFCSLSDVKCPCNEAEKDIEEHGNCHCQVFFRKGAIKGDLGKYASNAIVCSARPGVCFNSGQCDSCDFAKKYEVNKRFFQLIEDCTYRDQDGDCKCEFKKCLGSDCWRMMKVAEKEVSDGRTKQ